jgi:hypothetical protein
MLYLRANMVRLKLLMMVLLLLKRCVFEPCFESLYGFMYVRS